MLFKCHATKPCSIIRHYVCGSFYYLENRLSQLICLNEHLDHYSKHWLKSEQKRNITLILNCIKIGLSLT